MTDNPPPGWQPYGAPPPPPHRSRGPLVAVAAVVALLLVGGLVTALVLVGRGDDPGSGPTAVAGAPGSADPAEAGADRAVGTGYSYVLPEGWADVTRGAQEDSPTPLDLVTAPGLSLETSTANVIVETGPAGGATDPEALRAAWEATMVAAVGVEPDPVDGVTIDGEDSIGNRFERTNENGLDIIQVAYLTVHGGAVFSVILSTDSRTEDEAREDYAAILESWTWQ